MTRKLYTSQEAASMLGISPQRYGQIVRATGIQPRGQVGRSMLWGAREIRAAGRARKPLGRPRAN